MNGLAFGRIKRSQPRFSRGDIYFLDTIPRTFVNVHREEVLFNSHGFLDRMSGYYLPDGELVKQYVRWPTYARKDIPDCLADIEATDKEGNPLIRYIHPSLRRRRRTFQRGESVLDRLTADAQRVQDEGVVPLQDFVSGRGSREPNQDDYFDKKNRQLYGG